VSATEWLVVLIAGVGGYWLLSFLMGGRKVEPPLEQKSTTGSEPASLDAQPQEWWEVLGVSAKASPEEIREAYRKLIAQYHPDKVASLGPEIREVAHRKSQQITEAYRTAMQLK
jgi:DnaJ like chaperone protein